jgi:hypothetical protein
MPEFMAVPMVVAALAALEFRVTLVETAHHMELVALALQLLMKMLLMAAMAQWSSTTRRKHYGHLDIHANEQATRT